MKTNLLLFVTVAGLVFSEHVPAQDAPKSEPSTKQPGAPGASAGPAKPKPTQEELEANFKATLTKATFKGRWCMIKDGQLGPEKEDKYSINSVTKIGGEMWLITARIQYGKNDFVAPVPVLVKWAGDTPVIVLDKLGVAGSGEFSARVLVFDKTYAGTWSGGDHGGLLNGVIAPSQE